MKADCGGPQEENSSAVVAVCHVRWINSQLMCVTVCLPLVCNLSHKLETMRGPQAAQPCMSSCFPWLTGRLIWAVWFLNPRSVVVLLLLEAAAALWVSGVADWGLKFPYRPPHQGYSLVTLPPAARFKQHRGDKWPVCVTLISTGCSTIVGVSNAAVNQQKCCHGNQSLLKEWLPASFPPAPSHISNYFRLIKNNHNKRQFNCIPIRCNSCTIKTLIPTEYSKHLK